MGDINNDILNKSHTGIIGLRSIRTYLTKSHISFLIETISNEIYNDSNSSKYELSIKSNLENFKKSLENHFQWMIDRTYKKIEFDDKYTFNDISNNFSYCAFYKKLSIIIRKIKDNEVKKYMNLYCNAFQTTYSC